MDWTEIKIKVPVTDTEEAEAIANMVVPYGIYVEDYSNLEQDALDIAHIDMIDEELLQKDRTVSIIHIYISDEENPFEAVAYLKERYAAVGINCEIDTDSISEAEWADNWKKFFKVTEIGERLVIRPSWEEYDNKDGRVVLSIDPGAAFGTGTHATTRMCLGLLERFVYPDCTLLDIGSGSGILSIAGVLLGVKHADGVDIDPVAVKVADENAAMNGIEDKVSYIKGDLCDKISSRYDVVCANIVADVIISLLSNVDNFMKEDSVFICSGIIDVRENDVKAAFERFGYKIIDEETMENWRAFAVKKI
ncbi:MAG: 50S ribosomal protein L11 methyltransferase [Clostridia bacterium]|nr:50S ribosomal protein L11 methyltransferase [Clostridia bacterium]